MVTYKPFNLLDNPSVLGQFDVVFCRNVLIYFDQASKGQLLGRVAQIMPSDGFLYLGGAETGIGIYDAFEMVPGQLGVYGLTPGGAAPARKEGHNGPPALPEIGRASVRDNVWQSR